LLCFLGPYLGVAEGWAPDFVPRARAARHVDPELDRFRPASAPTGSDELASSEICDPDAIPRPTGPAEADEEQEYADVRDFLGSSQQSNHVSVSAPPFVPPPPSPVPLSDEIRTRITANRGAARKRRAERAAQARAQRLLEVAPWTVNPEFGTGLLFDPAPLPLPASGAGQLWSRPT